MSLHYLLDGYNITKQLKSLVDLSLEEGRRALVAWLNGRGVAHDVTVVFDGDHNVVGQASSGMTRVIFTDYGSADDKIKQIVEEARDPKNYVVVSNDKDIILYIRALGAKGLSVQEFMGVSKGNAPGRAKAKSGDSLGKYISQSTEARINKEFYKIWLNK